MGIKEESLIIDGEDFFFFFLKRKCEIRRRRN